MTLEQLRDEVNKAFGLDICDTTASPSFYTVEHDLSQATAIVDRLSDRGDGKPVTVDYLDLLSD